MKVEALPENKEFANYLEAFADAHLDGPTATLIEQRANLTEKSGALPLWAKYRDVYGEVDPHAGKGRPFMRSSNQVRTTARMGKFFHRLVLDRKPDVVVEIGTAFGISGMYWLSGLEANDKGVLLTFDPNEQWGVLAVQNLQAIGSRFLAIRGPFESEAAPALQPHSKCDIAFVDAIHTPEFVSEQVRILRKYCIRDSIIAIDDIKFSKGMYSYWKSLSTEFRGAVELDSRVGVLLV